MKTFTWNFCFKMSKLFSIRFLQRIPLIIALLSMISFSSPVSSRNIGKKICQTKECLASAQNLKESMNFNVDPCDDFYQYACGNWSQNSDQPRSATGLRRTENHFEVLDFLKQNNSYDEPEAVHKVRKFFSLCMNEAAHNNELEPIKATLKRIGLPDLPFISNETENDDYPIALARAARLAGQHTYFTIGVNLNHYNRAVNMIELKKGTFMGIFGSSKIPFTSLENHMFEALRMICAGQHSKSCTKFRTGFDFIENFMIKEYLNQRAEIGTIIFKPRSILNSSFADVYTLKQLQDLTDKIAVEVNSKIPTLNWTKYIEEMFADLDDVTLDLSDPNEVHITIEELEAVKEMIQFIHRSKNTKMIKIGLWWNVVFFLQPLVSSDYFDEVNCFAITEHFFGMALSYVYATKEKYIKAKIEIGRMVENIQDSFQQLIQQAPWMDEMTRHRALKKLQFQKNYIAYPSMIKTTPSYLNDMYNDVQITDNFYDTIISLIQNGITKQLKKINRLNDLLEEYWTITPNLVCGYNDPNRNSIIIPAAFLGLSVYNNSLHALDYGAIGTLIGHEMTHGFDNLGRRYNELGNIENWWQPETLNRFNEKAECFVKAYRKYSTTSRGITQKGNSEITLGEDISDNGGFKESLLAYRKLISVSGEEPLLPEFEDFSHEQLFTLAFANMWCENPSRSSVEISEFEVHSPKGVRVNGVLRNSEEFPKIWKCPKGSNMNPRNDKCAIW